MNAPDVLGDDEPPRRLSPGARLLAAALVALLAVLAVRSLVLRELDARRAAAATAVRQAAAGAAARSAAEAAALRLVVVGSAVVPARGVPGDERQVGRVELGVRNDGPATVRLLGAGLAGDGPQALSGELVLPPGETAGLMLRWSLLCAEVGGPGPGLLHLRVRTPAGAERVVRVDLVSPDLVRTLHAAAVQACDVLVRPAALP